MSVLKHTKKYLTYILMCVFVLITIFGIGGFIQHHRTGTEQVQNSAFVYSQPVFVSRPGSVSQAPRITAPWMSYEELAAWHLDAYYQVIIDYNIFRPLQKQGSGIKINRYQLIGTVEREQETVAYLLDTFTKKVHPITSGKRLDKFTVKNVTRKSVDLRDKKGVITKLELGSMFLK